jgi:hypothetical protein
MSRIDNLQENALFKMIEDAERDVAERKALQRIGGASVRMYLNTAPDGYGTQSVGVAAYGETTFYVRFVNAKADWSFVDLSYRVFLVGGGELFPGDFYYPLIKISKRLPAIPSPRENWWTLNLMNVRDGARTYLVQAYVQSTSRGSLAL